MYWHVFTWHLMLRPASFLTPACTVLMCFLTTRLCMCVCMLSSLACTRVCVQHQSILHLFTAQNLDKLWGCHGDGSSRAGGSVAFFFLFFAMDTEPIRLHMRNHCGLGCWMFKATSPLLFHSAISVAQLSMISWQHQSVWEEKEWIEFATLSVEQIFTLLSFSFVKSL